MATVEISEDKRKALGVAIQQIERAHGKGSIMRLGADDARVQIGAVPTGAISLDQPIGIGGLARGPISELYGPESRGKTTLCLHLIAHGQRRGRAAAFLHL